MKTRHLTPLYAVSPQISPQDIAAFAKDGFRKIICNRPDDEVPLELNSAALRALAESAGLTFEVLPLTRDTLSADKGREQARMVESAGGKVLAYCASGTRSTVIWAIGQRGSMSDDEIIRAAAKAGYDLGPIWPLIENATAAADADG